MWSAGRSQIISYLIDTLNPTGYAQVVEELQNGTVVRTYTYGHDLLLQDQRDAGGTWSATWYGYDGHGSVRFLTNGAGQITDRYDYDAFGVILAASGATYNRYRYCGEQYDDALSLYYLRARYMNAASGRFWSADVYPGSTADPATLHRYLYGNGDPCSFIDPTGFSSISELSVIERVAISVKAATISLNVYFGLRDVGSGIKALQHGNPLAATLYFLSGAVNFGSAILSFAGPSAPAPPTNLALAFAGAGGARGAMLVLSQNPALRGWVIDNVLASVSVAAASVVVNNVLALPPSQYDGNHSLPKFLGGDPDQPLHWARKDVHDRFHQLLEHFLEEIGISVRVNGTWRSTREWEQILKANPGLQDACWTKALQAARETDKQFGTSMEQAVWDNLVDGQFTPLP